jgi:molybdopterin biosynthesis enzyme MoaB
MSVSDVIGFAGIMNYPLVTTSDATPTEIALVQVEEGFAGMLVVDVHSMVSDGSTTNVGRYAVKYISNAGLTLGTKQTIMEDNGVAVSVTFADSSGNITIVGTGIAATEITWVVRTQILDQTISAAL